MEPPAPRPGPAQGGPRCAGERKAPAPLSRCHPVGRVRAAAIPGGMRTVEVRWLLPRSLPSSPSPAALSLGRARSRTALPSPGLRRGRAGAGAGAGPCRGLSGLCRGRAGAGAIQGPAVRRGRDPRGRWPCICVCMYVYIYVCVCVCAVCARRAPRHLLSGL